MSETPAAVATGTKPGQTIDERIAAMEAALPHANIAGTLLSRVHHDNGLGWCLALGPMSLPKTFFRGPTIESVLVQGEDAIANMRNGRLETDWDKFDTVLFETAGADNAKSDEK